MEPTRVLENGHCWVRGTTAFRIDLQWTCPADMDLGVMVYPAEGEPRLVYYGEPGKRDAWPFVVHHGDACHQRKKAERVETISVRRTDALSALAFFAWDHQRVDDGRPSPYLSGRFLRAITTDNQNQRVALPLGEQSRDENLVIIAIARPKEGDLQWIGCGSGALTVSENQMGAIKRLAANYRITSMEMEVAE